MKFVFLAYDKHTAIDWKAAVIHYSYQSKPCLEIRYEYLQSFWKILSASRLILQGTSHILGSFCRQQGQDVEFIWENNEWFGPEMLSFYLPQSTCFGFFLSNFIWSGIQWRICTLLFLGWKMDFIDWLLKESICMSPF